MSNATGPQGQDSPHPTAFGTPDASLVVFAEDNGWHRPAALNTVTDGTRVVAAGMVTDIREHGSIDAPRATLQLVNEFGQATYAAADTDVLTEYSMCLMDGVEVSVHGVARQPFVEDKRTTYIQIVKVEPSFG